MVPSLFHCGGGRFAKTRRLGIAVHAWRTVTRNRARSLGLFLGVALPVALISGVSTSVENTEFHSLESSLNKARAADYVLAPRQAGDDSRALLRSLLDLAEHIDEKSYVKSAIPAVDIMLYGHLSGNQESGVLRKGGESATGMRLLGLPSNLKTQDASLIGVDNFTITSLAPGCCLIDRGTATTLGLNRSSNISLARRYVDSGEVSNILNLKVVGVVDLDTEVKPSVARFRASFPTGPYSYPTLVLGLEYLSNVTEGLGIQIQLYTPSDRSAMIPRSQNGARIFIFLDRQELLQSGKPKLVKLDLLKIEQDLASINHGDVLVESNAAGLIGGVEEESRGLRGQFVALSLPLLGLSLYIGLVGGENALIARRQEIGLLRARGMKPKAVFRILVVEALYIGIMACSAGILLGWCTSGVFNMAAVAARGLDSSVTLGASAPSATSTATGVLQSPPSLVTTLISLIAGMGIVLGPVLGLGRKAVRVEPSQTKWVESLAGGISLRSSQAEGSGCRVDAFLVILGLGSVVSGLLYRSQEGMWSALYGVWAMIAETLLIALYALTPIVPFLLIIGLTRLLTRRDTLLRGVSRLMAPLSGPCEHVLERTLSTKGRQVRRASFVIALVVGLAGLITVSVASTVAYRDRVAPLVTGGDLRVSDLDPEEALEVSSYLRARGATVHESLQLVSFFVRGEFHIIDPGTYPVDTRIERALREEIEECLAQLRDVPKGAVVSAAYEASPGQTLQLEYYAGEQVNFVSLDVVGEFRVMPGLGSAWLGTRQPSVIVSESTFEDLKDQVGDRLSPHIRPTLVANLPPRTDLTQVAEDVGSLLPEHNWKEGDIETIIDASIGSGIPERRGMSIFVRTEIYYLLVLALVGTATILVLLLGQSRLLLHSLKAKGMTPRMTFLLGSSMALSPVVMGVCIGIATGILTGYLWVLQTAANPHIPAGVPLVLGMDYAGMVLFMLLGFCSAAFLAAGWVAWKGGRVSRMVFEWSRSLPGID